MVLCLNVQSQLRVEKKKTINILWGTGALNSLMSKSLVDFESSESILVHGVGGSSSVTPVRAFLEREFFVGYVCVGIVNELPMPEVDFCWVMTADRKVNPVPLLSDKQNYRCYY